MFPVLQVYTIGPEYVNVSRVTGVHGRARVYKCFLCYRCTRSGQSMLMFPVLQVYTVGPEYTNVSRVTGVHGRARVC